MLFKILCSEQENKQKNIDVVFFKKNLVTSLVALFNQKSLLWQCRSILLIVTSFKLYDSLLLGKFILFLKEFLY